MIACKCLTCRGKIYLQNFGGPNSGPKQGFLPFPKFGLLVFPEIAYNDNLQHCLSTSRGKIHEKHFWAQYWVKQQKLSPKLSFLPFSQVWCFLLNCTG